MEDEFQSEPVAVTLEVGAPETTVELAIVRNPGLHGKIIIDPALDVTRVRVHALPFTGDRPPAVDDPLSGRAGQRGRYDRKTGEYTIGKLAPGRTFVWVTFGTRRVIGSAVVDIEDEVLEQDISAGLPAEQECLVLRVTGPDGEAVDPHALSVTMDDHRRETNSPLPMATVPRMDGALLLPPRPADLPAEGQDARPQTLWIRHRDLGCLQLKVRPRQRGELECRFEEPVTVTAHIAGLERAGLAGQVSLYLQQHREDQGLSLTGKGAGSAGETFVLGNVQPGDWFLLLVYRDESGPIAVDNLPVTLKSGDTRIDWALPQPHFVRLEPPHGAMASSFVLTRIDPAGNWVHDFGRFKQGTDTVYRFVPAGEYELSGTCDGRARRIRISVPAQTYVRLE